MKKSTAQNFTLVQLWPFVYFRTLAKADYCYKLDANLEITLIAVVVFPDPQGASMRLNIPWTKLDVRNTSLRASSR